MKRDTWAWVKVIFFLSIRLLSLMRLSSFSLYVTALTTFTSLKKQIKIIQFLYTFTKIKIGIFLWKFIQCHFRNDKYWKSPNLSLSTKSGPSQTHKQHRHVTNSGKNCNNVDKFQDTCWVWVVVLNMTNLEVARNLGATPNLGFGYYFLHRNQNQCGVLGF